jgi:general secretion pathway protein J
MTHSERGFTLLELLIAVSLLALLMALLTAGLRAGTHNMARQSERLDRSSRNVLVETFLRTELADARPMSTPGARSSAVAFAGREDGLTFVGPSPASVATGGLQTLSINFEKDGPERGDVVADWQAYGGGGGDGAGASPRRSLLLAHAQRAIFAYFGGEPGEAPSWQTSWENKAVLPSLVRLSVEFSDGELMPELVVALRLSDGVNGAAGAEGRR